MNEKMKKNKKLIKIINRDFQRTVFLVCNVATAKEKLRINFS